MKGRDAPPARPPEGLAREAAGWFARMRGPEAEASRAGFEEWLGRDPEHRSAYSRAAEIFAMGKLLADDPPPPAPPPAAPLRRRRLAAALASCVACALAASAWLALRPQAADVPVTIAAHPAERRVVSTTAGETRTVRLADGSTVRLEPGTLLDAAFDRQRRTIRLSQGQARFAVAHEARTFIVLAGGGSITARGTVFDVAVAGERIDVRLVEGAVDVALPTRAKEARPAVRRLAAGESLSFAPSPPPVTAAMPTSTLRDVDAVPIAALVAEANRSASWPIRLDDPSLGQQRVSGRFRLDDTALLAERLAALYGRTADFSNPREIVLRE
jgi:transmembrane sensor